MRKINNFLRKWHPSGLVDNDIDNGVAPNIYLHDNNYRIFVDSVNGHDDNDGSTWSKAVATVQAALDLFPYKLDKRLFVIFPAGTTYDNSFSLTKSTLYNRNFWSGYIEFVSVFNGITDPFYTNNGERTLFGTTPVIFNCTSTIYLSVVAKISFWGLDDDGSVFGAFKFVTDGVYMAFFITGTVVDFVGCIFDCSDGSKNVIRVENAKVIFNGLDVIGSADGATGENVSFCSLNNDYRGIGEVAFRNGARTWSAAYPLPFTAGKTNRITDFKTIISLFSAYSTMKWTQGMNGFASIYLSEELELINSTDIFVGEQYKSILQFDCDHDYITLVGYRRTFAIFNDAVYPPPLPTSDPTIVGALWNDAGSVKVSTG